MKYVYCTQCNFKSPVIRKAMPKYATIIDCVEPHTCSEVPIGLDLTETPITKFVDRQEGKEKTVKKLNNLIHPEGGELRDRRDEPKQTTTAPASIMGMLKDGNPVSPAHDMFDLDKEEDRSIK